MARASLLDTVVGWANVIPLPRPRAWNVGQQRKHRHQGSRSRAINLGDFGRVTPIWSIFGMDQDPVIA